MKTYSKIAFLSCALLALLAAGYFYRSHYIPKAENPLLAVDNVNIPVDILVVPPADLAAASTTESLVAPPDTSSSAPWRDASSFDLKPAFAPQAPTGNWSEPYQNACEEASAIMAARYFLQQSLDAKIMDSEIQKLVAWEVGEFGYYEDTPLSQIKIMLNDYFQVKAEILTNPTVDQIKQTLWQGHLVLVPAAGRRLDQPNFTAPGPIYHALIIRGWQDNKFITNDPGTRKGNGFKYDYENLMSAIFDPPIGGKTMTIETLESGKQSVLIVGPKL